MNRANETQGKKIKILLLSPERSYEPQQDFDPSIKTEFTETELKGVGEDIKRSTIYSDRHRENLLRPGPHLCQSPCDEYLKRAGLVTGPRILDAIMKAISVSYHSVPYLVGISPSHKGKGYVMKAHRLKLVYLLCCISEAHKIEVSKARRLFVVSEIRMAAPNQT
uniref:Uncharacterized protein n=1 Tax=Timema monikensis TaxID=170555 RepID=A0A7R9E3K8_9NEOP|nr:unnamed protein product [Timema monikensis]